MPDFRLDRAGIDLLLNALYAAGSRANPGGSPPQPVHFRSGAARERDPFSVRCGPCHRALTHEGGLLGTGSIGPNLSGLLSPFYPSGPSSPPWSPRRLTAWLRNPRSVRPWSTMGPVAVTPAEQRQIVTILSISPPHSELPGIHP